MFQMFYHTDLTELNDFLSLKGRSIDLSIFKYASGLGYPHSSVSIIAPESTVISVYTNALIIPSTVGTLLRRIDWHKRAGAAVKLANN